jgi:uncharacterized protein
MNIAIIGAGVSGLFAALRLGREGHAVDLFEPRRRIGGNMDTLHFQLDGVERFADLGVNDFNASTYTLLVKWLDELRVPYAPLIDECSFFSLDGNLAFTTDGRCATRMPPRMAADFQRFQIEAPQDAKDKTYAGMTVEEYVKARNYSEEFARNNLYPRINAMYYCHDTGAQTMPFRAVMIYYALQEGFGGKKPQRMYFSEGTASWTEALRRACGDAGVKFHQHQLPTVHANGHGCSLRTHEGDRHYESVVYALHPTDILKSLRKGLTARDSGLLASFKYLNSVAYVHQDTAVLPRHVNAWRSFNVAIQGAADGLTPYSMTYVENLHQNDPANPRFNRFDTPYFFTTLNPLKPLREDLVLRTIQGNLAMARFPHNTLDLHTFDRQKQLHDELQGRNGLYFVGGWTKGAGLQEECLQSVEFVINKIANPDHLDTNLWNHGRDEHNVPDYFLHALQPD